MRHVKDMPESMRRAIASVEVEEATEYEDNDEGRPIRTCIKTHKIKMWDKNAALEKIAKHLGMFIERIEIKSRVNYVIEVPTPIPDPLLWAKSVQARILASEAKEQEKLS
jgi:hypothetical protein